MRKTEQFINNNIFNLFLVFLIILNLAPFLAPIMADLGWTAPAKVIYSIYSLFCHQLHWRSIHIHDYQMAWCTRDTFIWGAILLVGILVKYFKVKPIKWYWIIPFIVPIALDGGVQWIATLLGFSSEAPFYMSTNMMRMLTGTIFGIGVGLWLLPMLKETTFQEQGNVTT